MAFMQTLSVILMKHNYLYFLIFVILHFVSCIEKSIENTSKKDTIVKLLTDTTEKFRVDTIYWSNNSFPIQLDDKLSHQKGFVYDSVIGIDYVGFFGEHFYYPINKKGQRINTIRNFKKLSTEQVIKLNKILGSKETYKNPRIVSCYEPRLGFVFFKNGKVIGQTQICLSCAQLRSTMRTVNKEYGGLFNHKATDELNQIRIELGLTSKLPWE